MGRVMFLLSLFLIYVVLPGAFMHFKRWTAMGFYLLVLWPVAVALSLDLVTRRRPPKARP